MSRILDISDEEHERISQEIENFMEFTRDVLNDPTILEHIPDGSSVTAVPIAERDPDVHYDIETPRYLAIVTPGAMDTPPSAPPSNGHTRRNEHDDTARLKRVRTEQR